MQALLKEHDRDIAQLRGATLASIAARENGGGGTVGVNAEGWGKFVKAVVRNDRAMIDRLGGAGGFGEVRPGEGYSEKTLLGSPLTSDTASGSYTVPQEFSREVARIAEERSDLFGLVKHVPMGTRTMLLPTEATTLDFHWATNQAAALTEDGPTFGQDTLTVYTGAAWLGVTEELLEDSAVILGDYIAKLTGEAWSRAFEAAVLTDNGGVSPFTGLLHKGGVNDVPMAPGDASFDSFGMKYCKDLIGALTSRAKRRNAKFCLHPTLADILADEKDAMGQYVWRQSGDTTPQRIKGYGFVLADGMPSASETAASTPFVVFGDLGQIYHGDRIGVEVKYFGQTQNTVQYGVVYFRIRVRAGFAIPIPSAFSRLRTAA